MPWTLGPRVVSLEVRHAERRDRATGQAGTLGWWKRVLRGHTGVPSPWIGLPCGTRSVRVYVIWEPQEICVTGVREVFSGQWDSSVCKRGILPRSN